MGQSLTSDKKIISSCEMLTHVCNLHKIIVSIYMSYHVNIHDYIELY